MPQPDVVAEKHRIASEIAGALANPVRLRILGALAQREQSVDQLADRLNASRGNTSAQLRSLARSHLIRDRREGRQVFYRLASPEVLLLVRALQRTAAEVVPGFREIVAAHVGQPDALTEARAVALSEQVAAGEVQLVDVRAPADHAASHLPGAISLPLATLALRERSAVPLAIELPVVVYCRGRYCLAAAEAVEHLASMGFEVTNLYADVAEVATLGGKVTRGERAPLPE